MIKLYVQYKDNPEENSELTLFRDASQLTLTELFQEFKLPWPPDKLILKVGKRRWYELVREENSE